MKTMNIWKELEDVVLLMNERVKMFVLTLMVIVLFLSTAENK